MNIHKNARLTPLGRERMVKAMLSGQIPERRPGSFDSDLPNEKQDTRESEIGQKGNPQTDSTFFKSALVAGSF